MPRSQRIVIAGLPHHMVHRGNCRTDVFGDIEDRQVYLELLARFCSRHSVELFSYSLMTNHVHLVATPAQATSLGKLVHDLHSSYALYYNRKYGRVGYLWQGRFYSCVLDEEHFWAAIRYVERNAVRAGLVGRAEAYPWSSARCRCSLGADPLISPLTLKEPKFATWSEWLRDAGDDEQIRKIRQSTFGGLPCGSDGFLEGLEKEVGYKVRAKTGRPTERGWLQFEDMATTIRQLRLKGFL